MAMKRMMDRVMLRMKLYHKHVAVIRLEGMIHSSNSSGRGITHQRVLPALEKAFKGKGVEAIALQINSPGGSPVQSSLIYKDLRRLKAEHSIPVLAFVEDVCASGGYYIASAADEIIADESSIVGSVGVIRASFGLVDAIEKLGVERRVQTAGKSKSQLDPFLPEKESDLRHTDNLLKSLHNNFIQAIQDGRGDRLKPDVAAEKHRSVHLNEVSENEDDGIGLFDGSFYAGHDAREIGFVDSLGDMSSEIRQRFGDDIKVKEYKVGKQLPWPLNNMSQSADAAINEASAGLLDSLDEQLRIKSLSGNKYGVAAI